MIVFNLSPSDNFNLLFILLESITIEAMVFDFNNYAPSCEALYKYQSAVLIKQEILSISWWNNSRVMPKEVRGMESEKPGEKRIVLLFYFRRNNLCFKALTIGFKNIGGHICSF